MLKPRWYKVLNDLRGNKTRTALIVVSIAVGLFAAAWPRRAAMARSDSGTCPPGGSWRLFVGIREWYGTLPFHPMGDGWRPRAPMPRMPSDSGTWPHTARDWPLTAARKLSFL